MDDYISKPFDPDKLESRFVGRSVLLGALAGALMLAVLAWRRRHLWLSRLSLPLVGSCAVAFKVELPLMEVFAVTSSRASALVL